MGDVGLGDSSETFANLVSVTFSAFDDFLTIGDTPDKKKAIIGYTNVGLKKLGVPKPNRKIITQDIARLSLDFAN